MDRKRYLIKCLQEEAAEVIHRICKCERFGFKEKWDGHPDNTAMLVGEINDFLAIVDMLHNEGFLDNLGDYNDKDIKEAKVNKYYEYSLEQEKLKTWD